ncbi:unnamed protein product [Didymodactylos carnosus]|uniref:Uncharacterized protein n=1 Tax=Didymodactylos carnosus TaxID=1234261 RepID=A0A814BSI6_9BILA|nr:unnamed protein product [Didymodactylos carnosus]CAF0989027.1 unnamed protein product [Didymodactylos carnosus]CAF3708539.1 unnamed protein product [Didymodactylos carnosus]CAF3759186.1 unnamed protein product [Didymodactylos carnosus]
MMPPNTLSPTGQTTIEFETRASVAFAYQHPNLVLNKSRQVKQTAWMTQTDTRNSRQATSIINRPSITIGGRLSIFPRTSQDITAFQGKDYDTTRNAMREVIQQAKTDKPLITFNEVFVDTDNVIGCLLRIFNAYAEEIDGTKRMTRERILSLLDDCEIFDLEYTTTEFVSDFNALRKQLIHKKVYERKSVKFGLDFTGFVEVIEILENRLHKSKDHILKRIIGPKIYKDLISIKEIKDNIMLGHLPPLLTIYEQYQERIIQKEQKRKKVVAKKKKSGKKSGGEAESTSSPSSLEKQNIRPKMKKQKKSKNDDDAQSLCSSVSLSRADSGDKNEKTSQLGKDESDFPKKKKKGKMQKSMKSGKSDKKKTLKTKINASKKTVPAIRTSKEKRIEATKFSDKQQDKSIKLLNATEQKDANSLDQLIMKSLSRDVAQLKTIQVLEHLIKRDDLDPDLQQKLAETYKLACEPLEQGFIRQKVLIKWLRASQMWSDIYTISTIEGITAGLLARYIDSGVYKLASHTFEYNGFMECVRMCARHVKMSANDFVKKMLLADESSFQRWRAEIDRLSDGIISKKVVRPWNAKKVLRAITIMTDVVEESRRLHLTDDQRNRLRSLYKEFATFAYRRLSTHLEPRLTNSVMSNWMRECKMFDEQYSVNELDKDFISILGDFTLNNIYPLGTRDIDFDGFLVLLETIAAHKHIRADDIVQMIFQGPRSPLQKTVELKDDLSKAKIQINDQVPKQISSTKIKR